MIHHNIITVNILCQAYQHSSILIKSIPITSITVYTASSTHTIYIKIKCCAPNVTHLLSRRFVRTNLSLRKSLDHFEPFGSATYPVLHQEVSMWRVPSLPQLHVALEILAR